MAPRRLLGRAAMHVYKNAWRRFRGEQAAVPSPTDSTVLEPAGAVN
jgi:hypothetical protein